MTHDPEKENDTSDESKDDGIAALAQLDPVAYDRQGVGVAKAPRNRVNDIRSRT